MFLKELIDKLGKNHKFDSIRVTCDCQIYAIKSTVLSDEDMYFENDVLYISQNLCVLNNNTLPQNMLFAGKMEDFVSELIPNLIQVKPDDLEAAIEDADRILADSYKFQSLQIQMMDIMIHGNGLGGILDEMGKTLDASIVIMDMSGRIYAYSHPFGIKDLLWQESIEHGYCPQFFMDHIRDVRSKHESEKGDEIVMRYCIDKHIYYLARRIYINDNLFGYIFIIRLSDSFSPFCRDVLNYIGRMTYEYIMRMHGVDNAKDRVYNDLMIDIFNGIPSEQIKSRALAGEMKFPQKMCIAAVKPRYFHGDNYVNETLSKNLRQMFPEERSVYYHKAMIVLFAIQENEHDLPQSKKDLLTSLCAQEHLIIGISNPYTKLNSTRYYYDQAIKTIDLAMRMESDGDVFEYKDFAFFDMLSKEPSDCKVVLFCHPALSVLRSYDAGNGSQLYDTLKAYVMNGFNQNLTAASLFLHRNTLAYRKQKIVSLTGIDFENTETQFMLHYSFLIDGYLDKTQH